MNGPPNQETLDRLIKRRTDVKACATSLLLERRAQGVTDLDAVDSIRFNAMQSDIEQLDAEIAEYRRDLERSVVDPKYQNLGQGTSTRRHGSAAAVSPMYFDPEELRSAHAKLSRGESAKLEARAGFVSTGPLPAQLYPQPLFPVHEGRLLDKLAGFMLEAPSVEYVQMVGATGSAGVVGEGVLKPEILMPTTKLVCKALKLACHAGVTQESWTDFEAFGSSVQNELMKQVTDLENAQLWGGDPAAGGLNGMTKTPGILTLAAGAPTVPPNNFDDLAAAIAKLRTGSSLATANLICLHPDTWANVRTQKDAQSRYLATVSPTDETAQTVWGVEVLVSTAFPAGEALVLDTTSLGRVCVRETLTLRLGFAGDDFVENVIRVVVEERLNLAVERPASICHVTGLPSTAPTEATATTKSTARK